MRAVIQRVKKASVSVNGVVISGIDRGLLVLLGLERGDSQEDLDYIVRKILNLRIFENEQGLFDKSVLDENGELLVVSQFTLLGDCQKGNRPSFTKSMPVEEARIFFKDVEASFLASFPQTQFGEFQAQMLVDLSNDGPVTLVLESR